MKTNSSLEFAVITGCLRISKESIFTGMNNLEIMSIMSRNYDEYFGFTEEEVQKICRDYGLEHKYELVKEWYNGYVFGDANVYNPWSVIRFIKDLKAYEDEIPHSYWANTSSNSIVRSLIERADEDTKTEIEANKFAVEFLIPDELLTEYFRYQEYSIEQMARFLGYQKELIELRLK